MLTTGNPASQDSDTSISNEIALVDQNGNRNSFSYNAADNKTLELDPLSRRTTLWYDIASSVGQASPDDVTLNDFRTMMSG